MENKRRHYSIFWPVLLIVVGVVLFLNNTGAISGDTWEVIVNLWPLLFIIGGIESLINRSGYAGPVVGIGLGVIFLGCNFGYLPMSALDVLIKFWPVLLIAWGVDLIVDHHGVWSVVVGLLVGLALVAGTFYVARYNPAFQAAETQPIALERNGATEANGTLSMPMGTMNISGDAGEKYLLEGTVTATGKVQSSVQVNGTSAVFSVKDTTEGTYTPFSGVISSLDWNLKLNPVVVYDLTASMGAGVTEFNLNGLQVKDLNVSSGVGKAIIILPESGSGVVALSTAVGQTVIQVPQNAAVRIELGTALAIPTYPSDFTRSGNVISSPEAATATEVQVVKVDAAIGLVTIEYLK
jgi:hypothetical protein